MKLLFKYIQLHHYKTFGTVIKTRGTRGKAPAKDTPNNLADLAGIWQKQKFWKSYKLMPIHGTPLI